VGIREYLSGFDASTVPWPLRLRRPPSWLAAHVLYYAVHGISDAETFRLRVVPHSMVALVIDVGERSPRDVDSGRTAPCPVMGLYDRPQLWELPAGWLGLSVVLTPWGARALFRQGMHALANEFVGVGDLLGARVTELSERLTALPDWPQRFTVLDDTLSRWFDDLPGASPEVLAAWARLAGGVRQAPIGEVADEVGWSRRRLEMRFRDQVGLPPRSIARIYRFHRAVHLSTTTGRTLAQVATACGYFDQSHLTRDIRALTGRTPTELLAGLSHSSKTPPQVHG
jgi:AraC-like DNA-binding protein